MGDWRLATGEGEGRLAKGKGDWRTGRATGEGEGRLAKGKGNGHGSPSPLARPLRPLPVASRPWPFGSTSIVARSNTSSGSLGPSIPMAPRKTVILGLVAVMLFAFAVP